MNRKQREERLAAIEAANERAREAGREYFKTEPEAILAAVYRYASSIYDNINEYMAFAEGYIAARKQRDEYLAERKTP